MAPARLRNPLDPIYQNSTWSQPIYVLDEDAQGVQTPADLTDVSAVLSLVRKGLPAAAIASVGIHQGEGLLLFTKAAVGEGADGWIDGDYSFELTLGEQSVLVGEVPIVKGANAGGSGERMPGATRVPGVVTVARAATGAVHLVRTDRVTVTGAENAAALAFNDALTMLGVDNVQDAIVAIVALIGGGPGPDPEPPEGFAFVTFNGTPVQVGAQPVIAEID